MTTHAGRELHKILRKKALLAKGRLPGLDPDDDKKMDNAAYLQFLGDFSNKEQNAVKTFEKLCAEHLSTDELAVIDSKVAAYEEKAAAEPKVPAPGSRVKLTSLKSRAELNGASGIVVSEPNEDGRQAVCLDSKPWGMNPLLLRLANLTLVSEPDIASERSLAACKEAYRDAHSTRHPYCWGLIDSCLEARRLCGPRQVPVPLLGQRVRMHGLQARPELNDKVGRAISFESDKGRYAVALLDTSSEAKPLLLRAANLEATQESGDFVASSSATLEAMLPPDLSDHVATMNRLPAKLAKAAHDGNLDVVQRWLMKGGHVDAIVAKKDTKEDGWTLLCAAAEGGHERMVRFLIDRGACVNLPDVQGLTPLLSATAQGNWWVVEDLLLAGADAQIKSLAGSSFGKELTPLEVASANLKAGIKPFFSRLAELEPMGMDTTLLNESAGRIAYDHGSAVSLLRWHSLSPIGGERRPAGINEAMREQELSVMHLENIRSGMGSKTAVIYRLGSHKTEGQRERDDRLNEWMAKDAKRALQGSQLPWQKWDF